MSPATDDLEKQPSLADVLLMASRISNEEKIAIKKGEKNYLVGKFMQYSKGRIDPKLAHKLVTILVEAENTFKKLESEIKVCKKHCRQLDSNGNCKDCDSSKRYY